MLSPMLALSWGRTQTITAGSTARTPNPNRTPHKCLSGLSHRVCRLPLTPS